MSVPMSIAEPCRRFVAFGPAAISDEEHLQVLLARLGRPDAQSLSRELIRRFGNFAEAVSAAPAKLRDLGIDTDTQLDLKIIAAVPQRVLRSKIAKRPLLGSHSRVVAYCKAAMAFAEREQFRILFLDKKHQLILDEVQQEGTVDHTPVYPREVARRALELSASALILAHNHPSDDPTPSRADIDMTRTIISALGALGIRVHDHIIVGRSRHASLAKLKLI